MTNTLAFTGGGGGVVPSKVLHGEGSPKVQPLTLLYTIFDRRGNPFVYLLLTNGTPFTYLAQNFVSLLTAPNAIPLQPFQVILLQNENERILYSKPEAKNGFPFRHTLPVQAIKGCTPPLQRPLTSVMHGLELVLELSSQARFSLKLVGLGNN